MFIAPLWLQHQEFTWSLSSRSGFICFSNFMSCSSLSASFSTHFCSIRCAAIVRVFVGPAKNDGFGVTMVTSIYTLRSCFGDTAVDLALQAVVGVSVYTTHSVVTWVWLRKLKNDIWRAIWVILTKFRCHVSVSMGKFVLHLSSDVWRLNACSVRRNS